VDGEQLRCKPAAGDVDPRTATRVAASCWGRGENFEGQEPRGGEAVSQAGRNTTNLMVGSTLQHTCRVGEAQAVRAVRNREDGTRTNGGSVRPEVTAAMSPREWTLQQRTTKGRSLEIPGEASGNAREAWSEAEMVASEKVTRSAGGS